VGIENAPGIVSYSSQFISSSAQPPLPTGVNSLAPGNVVDVLNDIDTEIHPIEGGTGIRVRKKEIFFFFFCVFFIIILL
jgi:hypothetical protein